MSNFLRQSTASQSRTIGPFLDDTDFKTAETGLTIANTDIKLLVNGGASANKNSGGGTHRANGHYGVTFDATDTATVGEMDVSVVVAGALPVFKSFVVLEEAVYDALFAASAPGYVANAPVNVAQFGGTNLTSASGIPEVKVASLAANAITATAINADAITAAKIADGAIDRATFAADTGLQSTRSNTAQAGASTTITLDAAASATNDFYKGAWVLITGGTGAGQARQIGGYNGSTKVATVRLQWATNPDNTSTFAILPAAVVDANITHIEGSVVSTSLAQLGVNVTAFGGTFGTFASGRPEVNTTHLAGSAVNTASAQLGVNVVNWKGSAAATVDAAGYPVVTVKDGTGQGEIATTSGAIDSVTAVSGAVGSVTGNVGGNVTGSIGSLATQAKADVNAEADTALADVGVTTTVTGRIDAAITTRAAAALFTGITSVAQWLGLIAGKQTGNSTARTEVRATGAGSGTFDETTDSIEALRDNMGTAQTGDAYARLGAPAGASVSADIAAVKVDTAAIKAKTDNLPSDPADESLVIAATDAIMTRLGSPAGASVSADIAALPTATENADAVWDEPIADHDGGAGSTAEALSNAGAAGTPPTAGEIADAVWEEPIGDHSGTSGSTAEQLAAAGAAGDPWATPLPGSYSAGQAGKIVGDALDATVSSRATPSDVPTANQNADALLDRANAIETGLTLRGAQRLQAAALAGKASGLNSTTAVYRNAVADSKDRITATVTADGNRTAVSTDVS